MSKLKKKPEGEGRGEWSDDAMKLVNARGSGLVERSPLRGQRTPDSKPDSTECRPMPRCLMPLRQPNRLNGHRNSAMFVGLFHVKSYEVIERPPAVVFRKFGERVPAQVSSSSSDKKITTPVSKYPSCCSKTGR
ncbi:hypothetical protein AVEN_94107-1 [Araneus ventricosus]|uniref:Uncharacterized protein n=1 Tax=Araneus ventricosus TaxID=182803 RepID=A0A4Y2MRD6_ARAVE|nr:hypothetical protein AVEN_94107-1 [Araneus ventricosus]